MSTLPAENQTSTRNLRLFYLTGIGLDDAVPDGPLVPAGFRDEPARLDASYPLYLIPGQQPKPLRDALAANEWKLVAGELPRAFTDRNVVRVSELIAAADRPVAYAPGSETDRVGRTNDAYNRALKILEQNASIVCLSRSAALAHHVAALAVVRTAKRAQFLDAIKRSLDDLRNLIAIDDRLLHGSAPETVASAMGSIGGQFLSVRILAQALEQRAKPTEPMTTERRARIQRALTVLDAALTESGREPACWIVTPDAAENDWLQSMGARPLISQDVLGDALALSRRQMDSVSRVVRAMRIADLERENAFDASLHDELLRHYDWRALSPDDIAAAPPVVAFLSADRLAEAPLKSFDHFLRAGLPVQLLVTGTRVYTDHLQLATCDFGSLAIATQEVFTLQTSVADPQHLASGLREMAATSRPAVAIVEAPPRDASWLQEWTQSRLLTQSKTWPLYRYDPDAFGDARFVLTSPDATLASGAEDTVPDPITTAHALAANPRFRRHFRLLPLNGAVERTVELAQALGSNDDGSIPFISTVDENGLAQRAVLSADVLDACQERGRNWARLAPKLSPPTPVPSIPEEAVESARRDGANEAYRQVMAILGMSEAELAALTPAAAPSDDAAITPGAATVADKAPGEAHPAEVRTDPYIDSALCTSCNDCQKVNNRMFGYDGNKQALIADAKAGTYAELVKAAEACPAQCIHPGTPRPDDKTATKQMLARGAKFQ